MHIGINAQLLSFSENFRNGGISRYIRYLLTELARQPGPHEYTIFVNGQEVAERLKATAGHPQIHYVAAAWPESKPVVRVAWEQFTLPSLIRQRHIDVLHAPANVLPEFLPRSCAGVVTLHDLAFLRFPDVLTRPKRAYHHTFTMRSLRQHATRIMADSNSTRQDAIELAGIPAARIQTVYPCIDARFSNVVIEEKEIQAFRHKQGLAGGFLLYLGTLEPRKNLVTLLEAFARLRKIHGRAEKLVLAGGKGWLYDTIFAKVRELGLEAEVLFPGFVTDEQQVSWYTAASAFVYPSLYEGFGLPVAEALACGIPAVTSSVSSLPEAGAGLALTVNPHDVPAIAEAINTALTDASLRERCRVEAHTVAERFSAHSMLEQIRRVYEQAYAALHQGVGAR